MTPPTVRATPNKPPSPTPNCGPGKCPHLPLCAGLFSPCVTAWLASPHPIGSDASLALGRLCRDALARR